MHAPRGVVTPATIIGEIWLGFEACVGLTPNADSPVLPPIGQDDFVLVFPRGWKVVPDHPSNPLFGDHFRLVDRDGRIVAEDGDVLEARGQIRAIEATHCGFGWPMSAREAERVGD